MPNKLLAFSFLSNLILIGIIGYMIYALGGFSYLRFKMKNKGITGTYQHRVNLFQQLPLQKGDIVFLGNSITEQCEWSELLNNSKIKNRGISGDMTDGVLKRLNEITKATPSKIFLMIGVNDLILRRPEEIIDLYGQIVDRIINESPESELFIQSVLPINNEQRNTGLKNIDILKINSGIQELATKNKLNYIDLHTLLKDEKGQLLAKYTKDGIHINGDAYLIWKTAIQDLVEENK